MKQYTWHLNTTQTASNTIQGGTHAVNILEEDEKTSPKKFILITQNQENYEATKKKIIYNKMKN